LLLVVQNVLIQNFAQNYSNVHLDHHISQIEITSESLIVLMCSGQLVHLSVKCRVAWNVLGYEGALTGALCEQM